jgi:hypothetical protein
MIGRGVALALAASLITGCAHNTTLADFRRTLGQQDSATLALEHWCTRRAIMVPGRIQATTQNDGEALPATPEIRAALGVGPAEPVRARHVLLACANIVLSDARNWYVPARLTPEMNRTLDTTRMPFGKVVAPLGLHRQPVPAGMASPAACPANTIHHVTAVLRRDDGAAISLVSECYTRANTDPR